MSEEIKLPIDVRIQNLRQFIDPGFINYRLCSTIFGEQFDNVIQQYAAYNTHHIGRVRQNRKAVEMALDYCRTNNVPTLAQCLCAPAVGTLFCSMELLVGTKDVHDKRKTRYKNEVLLPFDHEKRAVLNFGDHFVCDTGKTEQTGGWTVSIIGQIRRITDAEVDISPLIMGGPSFEHPLNGSSPDLLSLGYYYDEKWAVRPEEIDEFAKMKSVDVPPATEWQPYMKALPEEQVKAKLCELLKDIAPKDWGGEHCDLFSSQLHIQNIRFDAAFLLKGPAKFKEMVPPMLGKNGDQIFRMSELPANLLIVQHCHKIGPAVRATLRRFAVSPSNPRRFCFIDGQDTYRLLKAYGKI